MSVGQPQREPHHLAVGVAQRVAVEEALGGPNALAEREPEHIAEFIAETLGKAYIEQPPLDLHTVFPDATHASPLR